MVRKKEKEKIEVQEEEKRGVLEIVEEIEHNEKQTKRAKIIIVSCILLVILSICFLLYLWLRPKIVLKGKETMILNYQEKYQEQGAYVSYFGKKLTPVLVTGKVNVKKLGEYRLLYTYQKGIFHLKKARIVRVVDKEAPIITLTGEHEVLLCPGKEYQELGFIATDNYDKDVTKKVKVHHDKKNKEIRYTVEDSSHNKQEVIRKYEFKDVEKPTITLTGSNEETMYQGQKYVEDGYIAMDNCDGDITSKVEVEGTVDTSQLGTYLLKYRVMDSASNEAIVERKINVIRRPASSTNGNGNGVIYLTFDDGPSSSITPGILDILKEEGVKATFFVINHDSSLDYLIQREYQEGHTVGLHSYSHQYNLVYQSKDAYFQDLNAIGNKVKSLIGIESKIIRFPGGGSNTVSRKYSQGIMSILTNEVLERGYRYYDWNVGSGDAGEASSPSQVYQNVINRLSHNKTNIVLMHDFNNNYKTLNALRDIIHYGKNNGYTFSNIDMSTPMVRHRVNN